MERKSPPGPREIIQELDHTATFWPLGFEEEVMPVEQDEEREEDTFGVGWPE